MATRNQTGNARGDRANLPHAKLCAICQKEYRPRFPREFFCNKCYHTWHKEIKERLPWVKFCISSEWKRREQEKELWMPFSDRWDVDDSGNLVYSDNYRTLRPRPSDYRIE